MYAGITLFVDHGRLLLDRPNRPPVALAPMGGRRFRLPRESDSSIELLYTADGRRAISLGREYYEEASAARAAAYRWALELAMLSLMSLALPATRACFGAGGLGGGLLARPLVAALCLLGMWWTFESARASHSLGACNPATVSIWVLSWGFAGASLLAFERAARAVRATLPGWLRAYALLTAGAAAGVAVHLFYYGIIGLRTWRW